MSFNEILRSAVNNVQNQEFDKEQYAKEKQEKREWAFKTQDEMAEKVTQDTELLKTYLDVQSVFDSKSVGNALLITAQNPKATQLRDAKGWIDSKVHIKRHPDKITILEPREYTKEDGTEATSFDTIDLIDISQTQSRGRINTLPYTQKSILKGILTITPVEVKTIENGISNGKTVSLNVEKRIIEVDDNADTKDIIKGLINEVASIHMGTFENTQLNNFENTCATYLICKKYGIATQNIEFYIPQELKEMSPQDIKAELGKSLKCFQDMKDEIDKTIETPNKSRSNREYER